ncbi:MAG: NUDIX domain-containing protein, partial [Bdellovibrionales bacterium]|nr:NUDIX domain-containing protein [Bdellovibrionales bacterium]
MTPMQAVQHMNLDIAPRVHISTVKNFAQIGRLPSVSLVGHPESYPMRFPVPDRFISWNVAFDQYAPSFAESESCVEVPSSSESYEEPVSNDPETQLPHNPAGRTGLIGRGALWSYGANQAADAVVLRGPQPNGDYKVLLIERDHGSLAFPGGFLDPGEDQKDVMLREIAE